MRATRTPTMTLNRAATATPLFRENAAYCPRCRGLLLRDYGELSCIACAYTFEQADGVAVAPRRGLAA